MKVTPTALPEVLILEPAKFADARGCLFESYNKNRFKAATGLDRDFVQDNHSTSTRNVVRGLHYQISHAQGKLVRVVVGEIFDVAVDLRRSSPTLGRWVGVTLNDRDGRQLWVPEGFGHGFMVVSDTAEVLYKATDYYVPTAERTIIWNDPTLAVEWPASAEKLLSPRDLAGTSFANAELYS